mgnify:FL=1
MLAEAGETLPQPVLTLFRRRWALIVDWLLWAVLATPVAGALLTPPHRSWLGVRLVGGLLVLGAAAWASRRARWCR